MWFWWFVLLFLHHCEWLACIITHLKHRWELQTSDFTYICNSTAARISVQFNFLDTKIESIIVEWGQILYMRLLKINLLFFSDICLIVSFSIPQYTMHHIDTLMPELLLNGLNFIVSSILICLVLFMRLLILQQCDELNFFVLLFLQGEGCREMI